MQILICNCKFMIKTQHLIYRSPLQRLSPHFTYTPLEIILLLQFCHLYQLLMRFIAFACDVHATLLVLRLIQCPCISNSMDNSIYKLLFHMLIWLLHIPAPLFPLWFLDGWNRCVGKLSAAKLISINNLVFWNHGMVKHFRIISKMQFSYRLVRSWINQKKSRMR